MGAKMAKMKKGAKEFASAYDGELSNLMDGATNLVQKMSKK